MITADPATHGRLRTKSVVSETVLTKHEKPDWLGYTASDAQIVPGKGAFYDVCFLDFNIDLESGICSVAVDEKTGKVKKSDACSYCYSLRLFKKNGPYKAKKVREKIFADLKTRIPEFSVLRIGKFFECGSKLVRSELLEVLRLCVKYNIRPFVTSKILDFDVRVADLVIAANGVIHISLGNDYMERGAVKHGYTNERRYDIAKLYATYGVVCGVRVIEDITMPMPEFIKQIHKEDFHILLTPLYYKDKATFTNRRSDITWDEAKELGIFKFEHGALHSVKVHPDWKTVKERCGTINGKMHCNNCSLKVVHFSDEVGSSKKQYHQKLKDYGWE